MASYRETSKELIRLLRRFGPPRKTEHPENPFWRLQNDDIWEVEGIGRITENASGQANVGSLRQAEACGGFPREVFDALKADEGLATEIADLLLDSHFPPTLHEDVLQAVGIVPRFGYVRRRLRDSRFSDRVLAAYAHQCAVCHFGVRLGGDPVGLEAAHIRWHRSRGPDEVRNALALCALHHKLFDAGAFTLSLDFPGKVEVAPSASGRGFDDSLGRFASRPVSLPARDGDSPDPAFLRWHHRQVFKRYSWEGFGSLFGDAGR